MVAIGFQQAQLRFNDDMKSCYFLVLEGLQGQGWAGALSL